MPCPTAVEVELTRKTEARVAGILRVLLAAYDDVYRAAPGAGAVVERAVERAVGRRALFVRPFSPPILAAIP